VIRASKDVDDDVARAGELRHTRHRVRRRRRRRVPARSPGAALWLFAAASSGRKIAASSPAALARLGVRRSSSLDKGRRHRPTPRRLGRRHRVRRWATASRRRCSPPTPTRARSRAWPARCSCTLRAETLLAALLFAPSIDGAPHKGSEATVDGRARNVRPVDGRRPRRAIARPSTGTRAEPGRPDRGTGHRRASTRIPGARRAAMPYFMSLRSQRPPS
jgi:hypothetical protein